MSPPRILVTGPARSARTAVGMVAGWAPPCDEARGTTCRKTTGVGLLEYMLDMPRRRRPLQDVMSSRPRTPYLPDGTLDPREWQIACSAANVLTLVVLRDEPWFVCARPVEVFEHGVELEVVVRWVSSEVWKKVPCNVDGYTVNVVQDGQREELHTVH